jgi:hypothetical protein
MHLVMHPNTTVTFVQHLHSMASLRIFTPNTPSFMLSQYGGGLAPMQELDHLNSPQAIGSFQSR